MADLREGELERLRRRLEVLEARLRLNQAADEAVERALEARLGPRELLAAVLPLLCEATGARRAAASVLEEGEVVVEAPSGAETAAPADERALSRELAVGARTLGFVRIDLPARADAAHAGALLDVWCEVLDDHVAMLALERDKHRVSREVSRALAEPILDRGLDAALRALASAVRFDDLVLVFRSGDGEGRLHARWVRAAGGGFEDLHDHPALASEAERVLEGDIAALLERLAAHAHLEEAILVGAREPRVIGRLVVGRRDGALGPSERDLLEVFADQLRQRLVDFTREHAQLSTCFAPDAVARLLSEAGYREARLAPREAEVAILYADLSGFTRISEVVLRSPAAIGRLVDIWSEAVVRAVWATGGVFDKMVGDCVIALWGPPFFEMSPADACDAALRAALEIRRLTSALPRDPRLPELAPLEGAVGVATGLNFAPLYVGLFGPNADFTGFSSGMNATARLQGLAGLDEILAMEAFVAAGGLEDRFGALEERPVKNVGEPLRYRRWIGDGEGSGSSPTAS